MSNIDEEVYRREIDAYNQGKRDTLKIVKETIDTAFFHSDTDARRDSAEIMKEVLLKELGL